MPFRYYLMAAAMAMAGGCSMLSSGAGHGPTSVSAPEAAPSTVIAETEREAPKPIDDESSAPSSEVDIGDTGELSVTLPTPGALPAPAAPSFDGAEGKGSPKENTPTDNTEKSDGSPEPDETLPQEQTSKADAPAPDVIETTRADQTNTAAQSQPAQDSNQQDAKRSSPQGGPTWNLMLKK